MESTIEFGRQIVTIAGILAGFSFTAIIELVSLEDKRKRVSFTIASFSLATISFLFALLVYFSLTIEFLAAETLVDSGTFLAIIAFFIAIIGLVTLLIGVASAGWIRSRSVGVFSTILVVVIILGLIFSFIYYELTQF